MNTIDEEIKKALDQYDIDTLEKFSEQKLIDFYDGMGVFCYACNMGNYNVIKYIIDRMLKYFKEKCISDDSDDDVDIDFFYNSYENQSTATLLLQYPESFKYAQQKLNFFDRDEFLRAEGVPVGTSFEGYIKEETEIIHRPPRSFSGERERQLLKQMSTVLFFNIQKYKHKKRSG